MHGHHRAPRPPVKSVHLQRVVEIDAASAQLRRKHKVRPQNLTKGRHRRAYDHRLRPRFKREGLVSVLDQNVGVLAVRLNEPGSHAVDVGAGAAADAITKIQADSHGSLATGSATRTSAGVM